MCAMGRVVWVVTCLVVAGLGVWFSQAKWDDANKVAAVLSALGAVAAIGVAIWAALRTSSSGSVRVSRTGKATASGGAANTGFRGESSGGQIRVERTGDAESDGGDANTGVRID